MQLNNPATLTNIKKLSLLKNRTVKIEKIHSVAMPSKRWTKNILSVHYFLFFFKCQKSKFSAHVAQPLTP